MTPIRSGHTGTLEKESLKACTWASRKQIKGADGKLKFKEVEVADRIKYAVPSKETNEEFGFPFYIHLPKGKNSFEIIR